MATWVIGDVQGCRVPLQHLLQRCRFDPATDHVVFTGDLVARGPDSVGTLRYVRSLGAAATTVLGNHDLHLLALGAGIGRAKDGLETVLQAPDAEALLDFLARQPLAWRAPTGSARDALVIHAGLAPQWSAGTVLALAGEVAAALQQPATRRAFLQSMYGDRPDRWDPRLGGTDRLRFIVNCLTRARYCSAEGRFDFRHKGAPGSQPEGLLPWFAVPGRATRDQLVVFGHWSTLGRIRWPEWRVCGLDTGCVWGGMLTALRLDDLRIEQVAAG